MVSGTNPAIAHALQAPPLFKAGATAQAVEITMFKKALEQEGKAALALLQSAVTGKGGNVNVSA
ncbi:MAG: hypothetical protein ACOYM9_24030 [Bradymonadia bacterium]|jgi:hypothetical protein